MQGDLDGPLSRIKTGLALLHVLARRMWRPFNPQAVPLCCEVSRGGAMSHMCWLEDTQPLTATHMRRRWGDIRIGHIEDAHGEAFRWAKHSCCDAWAHTHMFQCQTAAWIDGATGGCSQYAMHTTFPSTFSFSPCFILPLSLFSLFETPSLFYSFVLF